MSEYALILQESLQAAANPNLAVKMKVYMKDQFDFLGIPAPLRKEILRKHIQVHGKLPLSSEKQSLHQLWFAPHRELQYCAMELWRSRPKKQVKGEDLEQINFMLTHSPWWDTVDFIASNLAGKLLQLYPELKEEAVEYWRNHPSLWMNRTAILFQLKYKEETDTELLFDLCDQFINSKEFFHRKAIGWALRELSKTQAQKVLNYLHSREGQLSGLSKREALKHLIKQGYEGN